MRPPDTDRHHCTTALQADRTVDNTPLPKRALQPSTLVMLDDEEDPVRDRIRGRDRVRDVVRDVDRG